ncbi:uncharacterized protein LOC107826721 isoform X2 [Nicotiana tabacum]|uniref:Uncharacterized protein LOC107826721 isoform X2 n=3 Tax=Nicotiana tabacum TaxID=4097 RepID=A0AC58T7S4_TOBAC|nr:PREDICTED: uncharacterized protein LOC107786612 isoform X3 [Nicotiana tabacum]
MGARDGKYEITIKCANKLISNENRKYPEEFAHLFPTPSQAPNLGDGIGVGVGDGIGDGVGDGIGGGVGDGVPSPTGPRRSFDGSNYENGANNN